MSDAISTADTRTVDELNQLLRGELSAVETYDQSLTKFEEFPAASQELRRIRDEHRENGRILREHITRLGGIPSDGSGAWGGIAQAVTRTAKLLGPDTTLAALRRGEESRVHEYKEALEQVGLPAECKEVIRTRLLPRCQEHLANLDSIRSFMS
jgi:uncharacterized protein (TIGR02284 family)